MKDIFGSVSKGAGKRRLRNSLLLASIIAICGFAVHADSDWQAITLANEPGFTMEIPAGVKSNPQGGTNDLMDITLNDSSSGTLMCTLGKSDYASNMTRDQFVNALKANASAFSCPTFPNPKNPALINYTSNTNSGLPAATCNVSYADTANTTLPYHIDDTLTVAARHHVYQLRCASFAPEQHMAAGNWVVDWSKVFQHMMASLHLPKSER